MLLFPKIINLNFFSILSLLLSPPFYLIHQRLHTTSNKEEKNYR